jgi:hypothetical protein
MTPIVNGNMYGELHSQMPDPTEFNVLILGRLGAEHLLFLSKIDVLHNYLHDRKDGRTRIRVHAIGGDRPNMVESHDGVTLHSIEVTPIESLQALAKAADIDAVLNAGAVISKEDAKKLTDITTVVSTLDDLEVECETFLVGRSVPWIFKDAMWNTTWFVRYYQRPGLCREAYNFMVRSSSENGYSNNQVERVRSLTNKIGQIDFCKDILNSYLQRKRRILRHEHRHQAYSFELNYHLSNYYFLISGGLDMTARLMNDVYDLGVKRFHLGLEKEEFTEVLAKDHAEIAAIYTDGDTNSWIKWLKERRNFVAHEAGVQHTPLVTEKKVKMTPEELEQKIDRQTDWPLLKSALPPELYHAQREIVANLVRLEDYDEVASDVMIVRGKADKVFFPLLDIDIDYGHFRDIIRKTLTALAAEQPRAKTNVRQMRDSTNH